MKKKKTDSEVIELQSIKNLLILQLIRDGATSEEISLALKAGQVSASNIRKSFPMRKVRKKNG
jgi:hypothetical protein